MWVEKKIERKWATPAKMYELLRSVDIILVSCSLVYTFTLASQRNCLYHKAVLFFIYTLMNMTSIKSCIQILVIRIVCQFWSGPRACCIDVHLGWLLYIVTTKLNQVYLIADKLQLGYKKAQDLFLYFSFRQAVGQTSTLFQKYSICQRYEQT